MANAIHTQGKSKQTSQSPVRSRSWFGPRFQSLDQFFEARSAIAKLFRYTSMMYDDCLRMVSRPAGSKSRSRRDFGGLIEGLEQRAMLSASPFTPGDLAIYRTGGSGALSSAATAVTLDEYTPGGTLVQSIALPTTSSGANHALTASGQASSEGLLTLSADGKYLVLTGYNAAVGTASIASSVTTAGASQVLRDVGLVSITGNIDTSTTTTSFSGNNPRSAVYDPAANNGAGAIWIVGANTGVVETTDGGSGAGTVVSSTVTNLRAIEVFNGQLYVSTGSGSTRGVYSIGTGEPITTGTTSTSSVVDAPGASSSPYQYFFARLGTGTAFNGYDTLYLADSGGTIQKYAYSGSAWSLKGSITATGVTGLTGTVSGTSVTLYGTSGAPGAGLTCS